MGLLPHFDFGSSISTARSLAFCHTKSALKPFPIAYGLFVFNFKQFRPLAYNGGIGLLAEIINHKGSDG